MNNSRRKRIDEANAFVTHAIQILEEVRDGEQEALDGVPESFEEKREHMDDAIAVIEEQIENLQAAESGLQELIDGAD